MKYILGKKIGMVRMYDVNGKAIPITVVHCEPNKVIEVKTKEVNGYNATKVGFQKVEAKKLNKAENGVFKKNNIEPHKYIREFRDLTGHKIGDTISVDTFKNGQFVDVQGITKGHGFTGAIARWNFKIGPMSHGAGFPHRYQGSIAMGRGGSQAQRVPKGKKMSGHYGHELVTIQNLILVAVNNKSNLLLIKGALPGPVNSILLIKDSIKKPNKFVEYELVTRANKEEILKQNEALTDKEALHEANIEAEKLAKEVEEKAIADAALEVKRKEEEAIAIEKAAKKVEEAQAKEEAAKKADEAK